MTKSGGELGILNKDQLKSIPEQLEMFCLYSKPDIIQVAAWYLHRFIQNHYFVDGNKRVAFTTATIFFEINGYQFKNTISFDELYEFVISIANGEIKEIDTIADKL